MLTFVRRVDGVEYAFECDGQAYGFRSYRRLDAQLWIRRLPEFGWVVCDGGEVVSSRRFADAGVGNSPPLGMWVSGKDDRAYVYDLLVK